MVRRRDDGEEWGGRGGGGGGGGRGGGGGGRGGRVGGNVTVSEVFYALVGRVSNVGASQRRCPNGSGGSIIHN